MALRFVGVHLPLAASKSPNNPTPRTTANMMTPLVLPNSHLLLNLARLRANNMTTRLRVCEDALTIKTLSSVASINELSHLPLLPVLGCTYRLPASPDNIVK